MNKYDSVNAVAGDHVRAITVATSTEPMRALKRSISDAVYRQLVIDSRR